MEQLACREGYSQGAGQTTGGTLGAKHKNREATTVEKSVILNSFAPAEMRALHCDVCKYYLKARLGRATAGSFVLVCLVSKVINGVYVDGQTLIW